MRTIAELQDLVEREGATVFITIAPNRLLNQPGKLQVSADKIVVAANGEKSFLGPVTYGDDLSVCLDGAFRRTAAPAAPVVMVLDL
jgi:hypothetical protein